jgi:NAD(P)-dependent dehydrogenase (short-subunit alcohol dehydrogenase family)
VEAHVGSVADDACAAALIERCETAFGAVDVLVNCAGLAEPEGSSIFDLDPADWREVVDSHLGATFLTCRHAAPRMRARGGGAIVNTSSHSHLGLYGGTAYPAGKGGINSLSFALAAELLEHGIRVNAVCPGARTRLNTGPGYEASIRDLHRRGILGAGQRDASLAPPPPEHVGPLYAFLASPLARGITGRLFSAVGGYVGVQSRVAEQPLAMRHEESPWPVEELARQVLERLEEPGA